MYQGDLAPGAAGSLKTWKPGATLSFAKPFIPRLSASAQVSYAGIAGNDTLYAHAQPYRAYRAFRFAGKVREVALMGHFYPLRLDATRRVEPVVSAGVGVNLRRAVPDASDFTGEYFDPAENLESRIAQDLAVNASRPQVVFPVAVGVRYHLTNTWALHTGITYRFTTNDYLDGFSIATNPARNDQYYSLNLGLVYRHGSKKSGLGCPVNVL